MGKGLKTTALTNIAYKIYLRLEDALSCKLSNYNQ